MSDKIYTNLQSNHYCSRRLNATHQVGCSSELGGNVGVLWVVSDDGDIEHVIKKGPTPPYVIALRHAHFTRKNLLSFKTMPDRVAGVIFLVDANEISEPFSPDDTCPNRYSGLYVNNTSLSECKKNVWQVESPVDRKSVV